MKKILPWLCVAIVALTSYHTAYADNVFWDHVKTGSLTLDETYTAFLFGLQEGKEGPSLEQKDQLWQAVFAAKPNATVGHLWLDTLEQLKDAEKFKQIQNLCRTLFPHGGF